jgi:hypothetical protein
MVSFKKGEIMKSFNEWIRENIELKLYQLLLNDEPQPFRVVAKDWADAAEKMEKEYSWFGSMMKERRDLKISFRIQPPKEDHSKSTSDFGFPPGHPLFNDRSRR